MFGLVWAKSVDHSWDPDPEVRARNVRFEADLERVLTGGDPRPPMFNGHTAAIKAWAQAIGLYGATGAIAVYLVYMGSTELPRIARQNDTIIAEMRQSRERTEELIRLMQTSIRVNQQACWNAARDDNARQRCFDR